MTRTLPALAALACLVTACGISPASRMETAAYTCAAGHYSGDTLTVDTAGEDPASGDDTTEGLACILTALDTPRHITARMAATRALDGTQTGTWDAYTATWTYHPDHGMDVVISH
jgi:hypothetical protein